MNKNNKNTPSLDLSFAYGKAITEQFGEHKIDSDSDVENCSTGDTTIRAVTSLFFGKRRISGLRGSVGHDRESAEVQDD